MALQIDQLGGQVATIWSELRPATRGLVERALQLSNTVPPRNVPFDARADLELSRLLAALDSRAVEAESGSAEVQAEDLRHIANTCAAVLQEKTQSAEVFQQLVRRAELQRDYARIDALADALARFAPSEICELARSQDVVVRALAAEALAQLPIGLLLALLGDPIDSEVARQALRRQAVEYGSEDAKQILMAVERAEEPDEEI